MKEFDNNLLYYLAFSHFLGIGPHRFDLLMKQFKTVEQAYKADSNILRELLGEKISQKFLEFRNKFDPLKKLEELQKNDIKIITRESDHFPGQLLNIPDPPICLYAKGTVVNIKWDDYFLGIVGTRKPSPYGQRLASLFSYELAEAGFHIVSGMAMGIDALAHYGCLRAGGTTIAFLGCGVDIIYPSINLHLYNQIIKNKGLIMSEFPPGSTVQKGLFIARNRLISGLSKGVLVIEGTKKSGSLITARYAAEQGKEVFAIPVPITSELSEGPSYLIKQGAKLVTSSQDILDEFNIRITPKKKKDILADLSGEEKIIVDTLIKEPQSIDDIVLFTKLKTPNVLSILSTLEIKGVVEKNSEGKYQII